VKPAAGKRAKRPPEGPLDLVRESMDGLDQGISVVDGDLGPIYANQNLLISWDSPGNALCGLYPLQRGARRIRSGRRRGNSARAGREGEAA